MIELGKKVIQIRRTVFKGGVDDQLLPLNLFPNSWDIMPKCMIYVTPPVPDYSKEYRKIMVINNMTKIPVKIVKYISYSFLFV